MNSDDTPESAKWYSAGANWIVGLSTAAIGAGITLRSESGTTPGWILGLLILAGISFAIAIVAGVFHYYALATFLNRSELIKTLKPTPEAAVREGEEKRLNEAVVTKESSRKRIQVTYGLLLGAFLFGVALGGTGTLFKVLDRPPLTKIVAAPSKAWSIVTVPCCPTARCRVPQPHVLLTNAENGETWYMDSTTTAAAVWRRVAFDSVGVGTMHRH
jgi:hypothetical protein